MHDANWSGIPCLAFFHACVDSSGSSSFHCHLRSSQPCRHAPASVVHSWFIVVKV